MTSHSSRLKQSLCVNCASEQSFKAKVYSQVLYRSEAIVLRRSSGIFPLRGLSMDFRLMQSDLTGSETMCSFKYSLINASITHDFKTY